MKMNRKTERKSRLFTLRATALAAGLTVLLAAGPGAGQDQPSEKAKEKSWAERKIELQEWWPKQKRGLQERMARAKLVRRPETVLKGYEADPSLWDALTRFYDYIKDRELDVYYEQDGIPEFFPDREAYYNFLDTMIPAMRDRYFERNRIQDYQIHGVMPDPSHSDRVIVQISVTSDDLLPFKKLMVFKEQWIRGPRGWYPGKVAADPATYWERVR